MPVTFDDTTAARILAAVRRVEGMPTDPQTTERDREQYPPETLFVLVPTGGIPASSGTTLGSATCDLYRDAPASFGSSARVLQAVTLGGTQQTRVVHNPHASAIDGSGGDRYIPITRSKHGAWVPLPGCV